MELNQWFVAAIWIGLAFLASLISIRTAISVALVEIIVGALAGNIASIPTAEWIIFLAGFGSILLTFMAGAEVEPEILRRYLKESLAIGFFSFLMPFLGAAAFCYFVLHWTPAASWIGGISLSTTSVAVVYAVMLESRLNETALGKILLAACFITDLGTVLALGAIFAHFNVWLALFAAITIPVLCLAPRLSEPLFQRYGTHVSEPGVKFIFLLLFALGGLALQANSEAVLPAYLLGLVVAVVFARHKDVVRRLRTTVFAFLTPFYFLRAGMLISAQAIWTGIGLIIALLCIKLICKFVGVWPLTRAFHFSNKQCWYTTLLASTGLTFGSIAALFGFNRGYITQEQYTILVTVVIASAIVPTLIAQAKFRPTKEEALQFGANRERTGTGG